MLLRVEERGPLPIYRQIYEQIRTMVEANALLPGSSLPSTRRLAETLHVHRSTVSSAYQELWAAGYVELHPGRSPRVRERVQVVKRADITRESIVPWGEACSATSSEAWASYQVRHQETPGLADLHSIDFSLLNLDHRLFPMDSLRSSMNRVMREGDGSILGYGDSKGYQPLREWICQYLQRHGIAVSPDEVLLTNGSQHSFDLILRLLASPGGAVAIESPTYGSMIPLLRLLGTRPIGVPMLNSGMDLDALTEIMERERPALVYTTPSFQNPTGVSTSQEHRERLLALCTHYRVPILEDGFEEDMKYFGRAVLPIKSMDRRGLVLYCGTLSKVLFPGLRIGWIVADHECIERLAAINSYTSLGSSALLQAAVHDFCRNGHLDSQVSRMHRVFRKRMQTALRSLRSEVSSSWAEWEDPTGGYLIWLRLRAALTPVDWDNLLTRHGIKAVLGDRFFLCPQPSTYLRLSIASLNEDEIIAGVSRLAASLREAYC
ncbi:MAG: PLP-dependent aminotransferase family protein [Bacillota bacterium]